MRRGLVAALVAGGLLAGSCATEGTGGGAGVYDGFYYDDPWYYGSAGWWVGAGSGDIGPPPHPAHPIANPDPPRVENPIVKPDPPKATPRASTSMSRPMPSARPAMRGGGGRR
jgi:hypothetical protein